METYNTIINHPSINTALNGFIALLSLIIAYIFWRKRERYHSSSSWYNFGPGALGGGSMKSTPQGTWATALFLWFVISLLNIWDPTTQFWIRTEIVIYALATNAITLVLLLDEEGHWDWIDRNLLVVACMILSLLFIVSVFFHYNFTAVNLWFVAMLLFTIFMIVTRDYYYTAHKIIGFCLLLIVLSVLANTFPSQIPKKIVANVPLFLLSAGLQFIALILLIYPVKQLTYVRGR